MVVVWGCSFLALALLRLVQLPAQLFCEAMAWSLTFLAFPLRMLSVVEKERKLSGLIAAMQSQMDDLVWENKDLEDRLRAALKEQDAMEAVLDEMEEEHEDAYAKIAVLENQVKALKQENMRLKEHKGKAEWDQEAKAEALAAAGRHHGKQDGNKKKLAKNAAAVAQEQDDAFRFADPAYQLALTTSPMSPTSEEALAKAVARRRSLFSLGMSLAVGAVAWSADAPCLPLLAGLFAVVGVSMRSCAALRRAGDAVALLSLNWFLLGVFTSPMLPGVARAVVPRAGRVLGPAIAWFAAAVPL
ncbi:hypothetical protein EJB05_18915 [Eragrostis curvula]|uniref:Uncharacterized protein n=1 Tax=Eragrostis curvula TaxID=38414 RepID=A0A5J9VN98_9POAL|nr:hypothetical protein EJB05_18915 [Eragrostis curvula]